MAGEPLRAGEVRAAIEKAAEATESLEVRVRALESQMARISGALVVLGVGLPVLATVGMAFFWFVISHAGPTP